MRQKNDDKKSKKAYLAKQAQQEKEKEIIDNDPDWIEVDAETAEYLRKHRDGELDNERWYTLEEINERHGYNKRHKHNKKK